MKILDKRIETIDRQIGEMSIIKNNPQNSQNNDLTINNNKNNTTPINQYSITGKLGGDAMENMNSQKNFSSFNNKEVQKNQSQYSQKDEYYNDLNEEIEDGKEEDNEGVYDINSNEFNVENDYNYEMEM